MASHLNPSWNHRNGRRFCVCASIYIHSCVGEYMYILETSDTSGYYQSYSFLAFIYQSTGFGQWMRWNKRMFNLTEFILPKIEWIWKFSASFDHQSGIWTRNMSWKYQWNLQIFTMKKREREINYELDIIFIMITRHKATRCAKCMPHSTILRIISLFLKC